MDRRTSRRLTRPVAAILGLITLAFVISPVAAALPPANDELRTATRITALPFAEILDTSGATDSTSDPDSSCVANQGATVFYKVSLARAAALVADTTGSNYDTVLTVYAAKGGRLAQVACADDDDGGNLQAQVGFTAKARTTYYIMVGAFANPGEVGQGGALAFSLSAGS